MTQQGLKQKTVRALTGRSLTYAGDWLALFDQEGIPDGAFNGRMLRWLNQVMGSSYTTVGAAQQAFAEANGAFNWPSLGEFESFSLSAFMAAQTAGIWYRFDQPLTLFQGTGESTPVTAFGDVIGRANDQRVGSGSPANGTQSTNNFRPKYQADGAAFDALDDRLETSYTAGAVSNHAVARVRVPATIDATQLVAACSSTGPFSGFGLGINPNGKPVGIAGSQSFTVLVGSSDLRGTEAIIGVSQVVGGNSRVFANGAIEYDAAGSGTPNTSLGLFVGSRNSAGLSGNHYGGAIRSLVAWRGGPLLDLTTFNKIGNAL